jgi:beta-galactosidase
MHRLARLTAVLAVALSLCPLALAAGPRLSYSLDQGWKFKTGAIPNASADDFDDKAWDDVTVPHEFPLMGDPNKKYVYRGEAWYRKGFEPPASWKGQRVFLRFDAVAMVSDTYLNGEQLGEHRGAFAAFTYEITGKIKFGAMNHLAIRADDRMNQDVSPLEGSLLYGGIYRHVSILVTGPVDITPMDYSSPGVFLLQRAVSADKAVVEIKTEVNNGSAQDAPVTVRMLLMNAEGTIIGKAESSGNTPANKTTPVVQTITIPHPHLWNGIADPYLYSVRMELVQGDKIVDAVTQPLGVRSFHFDPKKGFSLNGAPYAIHGVCLHQDWGDMQWAIGPPQEQADLKILRDMGVDALRLVHYQHSQSALDLYDKTGMLVWSELAQFGLVGTSDAYKENVKQQLTEMIRQNYNHPSIILWSMYNEIHSNMKGVAFPIVHDLNVLAHSEDPSRPTVAAGSGDTISNAHGLTAEQDLIGDNNYAGWYYGAPEDMAKEIEKVDTAYDGRGLGISEYGGGAKITDHKQNVGPGQIEPYGKFQPEEWQALVHEGNYRAIKAHPYVWGSFIWVAFDTGGLPRTDGSFDGGNIKGLITQDRKTKKDAYFFYQANWTTAPMLYLTSRRDTNRTEAETPVKIYSNAPTITLTVNGKSYGEQKPDDLHVFHWKKITLEPGANKVEVNGPNGLHDEATWNYTATH